MDIHLNEPDILDYVSFATILVGLLCDILIIDTIIHKPNLRTGLHLSIMTWTISDMFYLFNTPGFFHFLVKSFGLHVSSENKVYNFQPHILEEPGSSLLIQMNCMCIMWILSFSLFSTDNPTQRKILQWMILLLFMVANFAIVFLKLELGRERIDIIRRWYIGLLIILIFVNEFQYFRLMCDDDMDIDTVAMQLLKINIIRVYAYNWSFVYFMKYVAAYSFHEAIGKNLASKYFYVMAICLTLTAFLTGFYVLIHLWCNDLAFRKGFIFSCTSQHGGNSINSDPNELSAIITGRRYNHMYYTTDIL